MKKFKAESKRVLDLMINSIYTHKEIFLRELLSNASDAIDKLYFKSLTGGVSGFNREDFSIEIKLDKNNRTLTISDNGIGMTEDELDSNLGVIARSGSLQFKTENELSDGVDIIGQFGIGFYSAFMVAKKVEVLSRAFNGESARLWVSDGADGYEIKEAERDNNGTTITLYLKDNADEENYDRFLEEYVVKDLVKKYSDYIKYPIKMEVAIRGEDGKENGVENQTLNSMVPIWQRKKSEIKEEEYSDFYKQMFYDGENPLKVIHTSFEGAAAYKALLFIPSHPQYNYYSKHYEKGLRLYTNGLLITENSKELLPDYFSFVKGVVDSDLTLNISRETVQHDRQLLKIAKSVEKTIKNELANMLKNDRETYIKFFEAFGLQLKYGIYDNWGSDKEVLEDLVLFRSLKEDKFVTLDEYVGNMKEDQKYIYYATGTTAESIKTLPQVEKAVDLGYDVLCMTDNIDEFALRFLYRYKEKEFRSVSAENSGLENAEEVVENKKLEDFIMGVLGEKISKVKFTKRLKSHPVCLTSEGELTIEMEKVLNDMPSSQKEKVKARKVLEINASHHIFDVLTGLLETDSDKLGTLVEVLFDQALLIEGLPVESPTNLTEKICALL